MGTVWLSVNNRTPRYHVTRVLLQTPKTSGPCWQRVLNFIIPFSGEKKIASFKLKMQDTTWFWCCWNISWYSEIMKTEDFSQCKQTESGGELSCGLWNFFLFFLQSLCQLCTEQKKSTQNQGVFTDSLSKWRVDIEHLSCKLQEVMIPN